MSAMREIVIPKGWKKIRIKDISVLKTGKTPSTTVPEWFDGDILWYTPSDFADVYTLKDSQRKLSQKAYNDGVLVRIPPFSVLVIGIGGTAGKVAYCDKECSCNQQITALIPKGIESRFLLYALLANSDDLKNTALYTTLPIINNQFLGNWSILCPDSFQEQKRIYEYLDAICTEIDALSSDIQAEIDTLQEYKRSVITEAVTKGLDKNAPMKDSGTDWLGYIPKHWDTKRGKYVFVQKNDKGNSKSLVLLSPTQNYGVIPQGLYEELSGFSAVKLNEKTDFNSLKTVHKGAFVISLRSFQGGFEYSEYEGVVSPAYQVFYPSVPVYDTYYKYLFKTQVFIDKMNSYTMSLRDGKNIAFSDFGRTYIPIPPVREQEEIAIRLDNICSELNTIIKEKQKQLEVLADYKKSVIYEYVTGKKEVPAV